MERTYTKRRTVAFAFLGLLIAVLIIRSFFSFCQSDESFYAALVHRFWIGEKPVQDEWNSGQFYAPLLLPLYGAYVTVHGSTEGVILFLRLLYLVFSVLTACKLFRVMHAKTLDLFCPVTAAAIILLYSRDNISGVSYYNLCMLCGISGFCSIVRAESANTAGRKAASCLWAGILLACAVLCDPFLAPVLMLLVLATILRKRKGREAWLLTAGIVAMAAVYCAFLLSTAGLQAIMQYLPFVLNNPEQSSVIGNLLFAAKQAMRLSKYTAIPALMMTAAVILDRDRERIFRLFPGYLALQVLLLALSAAATISGISAIVLLPLTVTSLPCLAMAFREGENKTAKQLYLFGLLNTAAYSAASNTGLDAGTVGLCMSGIAGIWMIRDCLLRSSGNQSAGEPLARRKAIPEKWTRAVFALLAAIILTPLFCQRVLGVYRDAPLTQLDTRITQGPGKGLYTTDAHARQIEEICGTLSGLEREYPEGRILFCKNLPWAYLVTGYGYGTSSPWRTYTADLERYYEARPENRADYICVLDEHVGNWEKSPFHGNPAVDSPNAFDYDDEFWENLLASPLVADTDVMRVYDVRETLKGAPKQ